MKKYLKPKELTAALITTGFSLENLRTDIGQKAAAVPKLASRADGTAGSTNCSTCVWVRDVVAPPHEQGETWSAIVCGADGKTYEIDFSIGAAGVAILGEPREVVSQVEYKYVPVKVEARGSGLGAQGEAVTAAVPSGPAGQAQPRKEDGKFHSAAQATKDAYAASENCKTKADHEKAADLHEAAAALHAAGNNGAMAKQHQDKATFHRDHAVALTAASPSPSPEPRAPRLALEAAGEAISEAPATFEKFMVMAGGIRTVTLGCQGQPVTVTINVNSAGAAALQQQLEAVNASTTQKVFNCFDHGGSRGQTAASSWPTRIFWEAGAIYESAEPSDAGLKAVTGKTYRGFSMTFFTDADITSRPELQGGGWEIKPGAKGSPENPANIICPDDVRRNPKAYLNMGTLTNKPAFEWNKPLFAAMPEARPQPQSPAAVPPGRAAGAQIPSTKQNQQKPMEKEKPLDAAALQERNTQLQAKIVELEAQDTAVAKAELRAAQSELSENKTKLELAASQSRIAQFEAGEKQRVKQQAQEGVRLMIEAQQIPALDKELQASWQAKFEADPSLIPLIVKKPVAGRTTPGGTAVSLEAAGRFDYGSGFSVPGAMKKLLNVQLANAKIRIHRGMSQAQVAEAYEAKGKLAMEAGVLYKTELAKTRDQWENIPGSELARCIGLEASAVAQPDRRALEAGDYTDPNNQFGILNGTLVLQRTLPLFALQYPELTAMYTDFSDAPGQFEQTETTHIVVVPAVQKYNTALDANGRPIGFQVVSPAQTIDAPITLTDYIAVPIVIGQNILSATVRRLFDEQSAAGIKAIAGYFTGMMTKLITPANFNAYAAITNDNPQSVPVAYSTYAKGLSDWSMTDLDRLSAIFTQNKVPKDQRGILLSPLYYAKLRSDPRLEFFFAAAQGNPQLTEQKLPEGLSGFFPYEAPYLPSTGNLAFYPFHKAGIMLKSRLPMDFTQALGVMIPGSVTTVTDPDTKISVALVQRVDLIGNYAEWRPEVQLGAAVGDNRGGLCGTTQ